MEVMNGELLPKLIFRPHESMQVSQQLKQHTAHAEHVSCALYQVLLGLVEVVQTLWARVNSRPGDAGVICNMAWCIGRKGLDKFAQCHTMDACTLCVSPMQTEFQQHCVLHTQCVLV